MIHRVVDFTWSVFFNVHASWGLAYTVKYQAVKGLKIGFIMFILKQDEATNIGLLKMKLGI